MSVTSNGWIVGAADGIELRSILERLPQCLGVKTIDYVFRAPQAGPLDEVDSDCMGEQLTVSPSCLVAFYEPNTTLALHIDFSELGDELETLQREEIPPEIHGGVILDRLIVTIGKDYAAVEVDDEEVFLQYEIGFQFWTYSTPPDCFEFERLLLSSNRFQEIKRRLEEFCGPLDVFLQFG